MPESTQLPLPGMPLRFIASATWEGPSRPCRIAVSLDAPSEEFSSQFLGFDTEGRMVLGELLDAMCTMLLALGDKATSEGWILDAGL